MLANTTNLGVCISVGACVKQNSPISFTVLGELDRIEQKIAKCYGVNTGLAGIRLSNYNSGFNNSFLVVESCRKCEGNNVFTCVEKRLNHLTVQLVFNSKFTYRVVCGNAFQNENVFIVGEIVTILYTFDLSGCLFYLKCKLTGYGIIVRFVFIVRSKYRRIGLASGRKLDVTRGLILTYNPCILTHRACGKCNLSQCKVGIPNRSKSLLTEYGIGIDLFNNKRFGYVACFVVLVFEFKSDAMRACIDVSGVFKHGKAFVLFAVSILNDIRKRMLLTVIIKLFLANNLDDQFFFLYFYLNCALDDVILFGIIGSKYGNVLMRTYVAYFISRVFPRPCTVSVLIILKQYICKCILVNGKFFFQYGVCNVKNARLNSKRTLLNIENDIRVRCRCGQRIHACPDNDIPGLSNREADQLSNHFGVRVTNAQKLIFNGGIRCTRNHFVTVDLNCDSCTLNLIRANECSLVVVGINFKVVFVRAGIGVVYTGDFKENDFILLKSHICFKGGLLRHTVVNKAFYYVRENNGFLCYVYHNGIGCENRSGCVFNEAYGESVFTDIHNGALGGIKLPLTDSGARKVDCREVIPIGCLNLGECRDSRLINCVEGHVIRDNTGNFRRPSHKVVTGLFRRCNLSQFGSVEHVEALVFISVNQKLKFVFYSNRNLV